MAMVAMLVAGPAKSKMSATPGLIPFMTRAAATGVDMDAHTYMGRLTANILRYANRPEPKTLLTKDSGTKAVIMPARIIPSMNQPARSAIKSPKAYPMPDRTFSKKL
jgi:hypothetical protein